MDGQDLYCLCYTMEKNRTEMRTRADSQLAKGKKKWTQHTSWRLKRWWVWTIHLFFFYAFLVFYPPFRSRYFRSFSFDLMSKILCSEFKPAISGSSISRITLKNPIVGFTRCYSSLWMRALLTRHIRSHLCGRNEWKFFYVFEQSKEFGRKRDSLYFSKQDRKWVDCRSKKGWRTHFV